MANEFKIPEKLVPKLWTKKVWREGLKASYFDKFTSTSGDNVVHTNKDLKQAKGDEVFFGLAMNLNGAGVSGNSTLKGNEDELKMYDFSVKTVLQRNAVKRFEADDQKSPYANLPMIKSTLTQWLSDWKDNKLISALTANPTTGERMFASAAGTEVSLTANDKLTCALIAKAKRKAKMHEPMVKPLKIDGQDKYIMLVGTWAARDLKADPVWQAAQQNAAIRGSKNPIFTGALGEYDGVVLYEYERVQNTKTGASSANVVHNLLLGQQAACFAVAREARFIKDEDDYGNVQGNGIAFFGGIEKSVYNSKDYGVIQVMTGGAVE